MLYIHPLGQEKLSSIQRWPDYTVQFQQNIPLWVFFLNLDKGGRWGGGGMGGMGSSYLNRTCVLDCTVPAFTASRNSSGT